MVTLRWMTMLLPLNLDIFCWLWANFKQKSSLNQKNFKQQVSQKQYKISHQVSQHKKMIRCLPSN